MCTMLNVAFKHHLHFKGIDFFSAYDQALVKKTKWQHLCFQGQALTVNCQSDKMFFVFFYVYMHKLWVLT